MVSTVMVSSLSDLLCIGGAGGVGVVFRSLVWVGEKQLESQVVSYLLAASS